MAEWIEPGKTIGIIGGGRQAYHLTLSAKELGYQVGILTDDANSPAAEISDWVIGTNLLDNAGFTELAMNSDVVLYATESFNSSKIGRIQKTVSVPQGEELLSVSQDRILQKVFFESIRMNIAPYSTVVSLDDIQTSVDSLGYPCVLKSNQVEDDNSSAVVLNNDTDIQKAKPILAKGTAVLEASLDVERRLIVNVVKDQYNNTIIFPISEVEFEGSRLVYSLSPVDIDSEVEEEIKRVAQDISSQFSFVGCLSVEVLLTPNGFLYVNELSTQTHHVLSYTSDFTSLSHYDALIKAVAGMPVPEDIYSYTKTVVVPFNTSQLSRVYQQMQIKPDWHFTFYPWELISGEAGYIVIPTDDFDRTLDLLEDTNL